MKMDSEQDGAPLPPPPLFGDILELTLARVPLIDLVSASAVSRSWNCAVSSSLRHLNPSKPWLLVHSQSTRPPYAISTRAFDPRSALWLDIRLPQPTKRASSTLRSSSHPNLLFMLSPSKLSFSYDPLHLTWRHVAPPLVWRADPIVALVGHRLVVAGGALDFDDDPLAVETYDLRENAWRACGSVMPALLKDRSASACLSVAADEERMYVTEKPSGVTHSYDPEADAWDGPYDLRPHREVYCSAIGCVSGGRLILVGLLGSEENVKGVRAWEVERGTWRAREIGEMPPEMVGKMKGERFCASSMSVCCAGDFVYVNRDSDPGTAVWCEVVGGGGCRWGRAESPEANGGRGQAERVVFTGADVGLSELSRALTSGDPRDVIRST